MLPFSAHIAAARGRERVAARRMALALGAGHG